MSMEETAMADKNNKKKNKKSGKTTTLNALVRHINETQNKKILFSAYSYKS